MKIVVVFKILLLFISSNSFPQNYESMEDYYTARNKLYMKDSAMRLGANIILNEDEKKVDEYLEKLQDSFIVNSKFYFPPSHYFFKLRPVIDSSVIFKIIKKMPKGGLLHCHSTAVGSPEWLIKKASYFNNCYMYTGKTTEKNLYGTLKFFADKNVPRGWKSLKSLRKKDPDFDKKLHALLTFNEFDKTNPDIWNSFEAIFTRMGGLIGFYPVFIEYNKNLIDSLAADNIQHVEFRTFLSDVYDLDQKIYTQEECLNIYQSILTDVRKNYPYFNMKLIYCGYRGWPQKTVMDDLINAFKLRKKYPEFLIGFDLVGQEDRGHTTGYFLKQFLSKDSLEKVYGIDMPFYFHDGESTMPDDLNLYDAILLGTKRIGHGINLFRFPSLFEMVIDRGIALEVCPLSNQILQYVEDLRMHPASEFINRNIPITIGSDDPQIFNYTGLSYDFFSAYMAWKLDLRQLKKLALNSIEYSGMNTEEKIVAYKYFHQKWDEFIKDVKSSYIMG